MGDEGRLLGGLIDVVQLAVPADHLVQLLGAVHRVKAGGVGGAAEHPIAPRDEGEGEARAVFHRAEKRGVRVRRQVQGSAGIGQAAVHHHGVEGDGFAEHVEARGGQRHARQPGQVGKREGVAVLREQGPLLGRIPQGVGDIGGGAGAVNVPLPAVIPRHQRGRGGVGQANGWVGQGGVQALPEGG